MADAMKRMDRDYEIRTMKSLPERDASRQLPYLDYKTIAIGPSMGEFGQALDIHVSSLHQQ